MAQEQELCSVRFITQIYTEIIRNIFMQTVLLECFVCGNAVCSVC